MSERSMIPKHLLPNPEGLLAFAAHKAAVSMENHLNEALINVGITVLHWNILFRCLKFDYFEETKIAKTILVTEESAQKAIKDLIEKDLIERVKDSNNPKGNLLVLTKSGMDLIPQIMPILMRNIGIFRDGIDPEDVITTINVLNKICHNLQPEETLYQLETPPKYIEVEN